GARAAPAARPRPGLVGAVEALEDALGILRGQPRARVLDLDHGRAVVAADPHAHGRTARRVRADVAEQVVDDLAQALPVAEHGRWRSLQVDRPVGLDGERRLDRFADDAVELHR